MPRASRAQAEQHREEIVVESSRLFRERGLAAVSVADVTGAVGMTHGGFYKHFASKEALATEAAQRAFKLAVEHQEAVIAPAPDPAGKWQALIDDYLRPAHRDAPADGCPATAFATDVAREPLPSPLRETYISGVEDFVSLLQRIAPDNPDREETLARYALLVGALTLARATNGDPISDEILAAARARLEIPG